MLSKCVVDRSLDVEFATKPSVVTLQAPLPQISAALSFIPISKSPVHKIVCRSIEQGVACFYHTQGRCMFYHPDSFAKCVHIDSSENSTPEKKKFNICSSVYSDESCKFGKDCIYAHNES